MYLLCWDEVQQNDFATTQRGQVYGDSESIFKVYFMLKNSGGEFRFKLIGPGGTEEIPTTQTYRNLSWYVG